MLRKTLRTLSAEGCGCVPALFGLRSQHWSLKAVVGPGLGEKIAASSRAHANEHSPELPPPLSLSPQ